jgi:hypothetical protein
MPSKTSGRNAHNPTAERLRAIHALQSELTSSPYSHDILELALAVVTSFRLGHQALLPWLMVVGVPSSDKTNTILALHDAANTLFVDALTEHVIASGFVDEQGKSKRRDLLSRITDGCVIIKDLTTLFSMRQDKINKILGDLQSVSDGDYEKISGVGKGVRWKGHPSFIGCITPTALAEHQHYLAKIGSRFLLYNVPQQTEDQHREGFDLQRRREAQAAKLAKFRHLVHEHAADVFKADVTVKPKTDEQNRLVEDLARFLARGRGAAYWPKVEWSETPQLASMQIEEPYRLYGQLRILSQALASVHGRDEVTDHELQLLRRVALSTIPVNRASVLRVLRTGVCARQDLPDGTGLGKHHTWRALDKLKYAKLVQVGDGKPTSGRPPKVYSLVDWVCRLLPGQLDNHLADLSSVWVETGDFNIPIYRAGPFLFIRVVNRSIRVGKWEIPREAKHLPVCGN